MDYQNKKMEAGTNGNALTALLNGSHGYIWLMLILVHWTSVGIVNSSVYTKISNAMRPMLCQWACRYCPQPNTSNRPAPKKPKHVHPFFFFFPSKLNSSKPHILIHKLSFMVRLDWRRDRCRNRVELTKN